VHLRGEIVQQTHAVTRLQQRIGQVGTDKSGAACDEYPFFHGQFSCWFFIIALFVDIVLFDGFDCQYHSIASIARQVLKT
jgi:hypothetical protein